MSSSTPEKLPSSGLLKSCWLGLILGLTLACTVEIVRMIFWGNTHEILAGRVYRSAQLKPEKLQKYLQTHQIQTVVNLRGRPVSDWYLPECLTCQVLEIDQEDVSTSANRLPAPSEIRRLIEVFDHAKHPILIHCQQGADRTGLAAALYLLLYTDADYQTAIRQCSPRYGHFPILKTVAMDRFFELYQNWLGDRQHTPALCREWATQHYVPYPLKGEFQVLNSPSTTPQQASVLQLRLTNRSGGDWFMKAGVNTGLHVRYVIHATQATTFWGKDGLAAGSAPGIQLPPRPTETVYEGRAGLWNLVVPDGDSVIVQLVIPPLTAGRYSLMADLSFRHVDGVQVGGEQLVVNWEVK